ncbi:MAG: hypothetical protein L0H79_19385 [Intrasporangium sp.]|uniref:hypothetical protein n=1 Tax=Intrasporangium sp. TaxID=1925024 RepID=UPI00264960CD|nr:hypothetical protein [Intrasporangium sp.]MDN5797889.1 hypothetical protein [Intrasporangium sp.]
MSESECIHCMPTSWFGICTNADSGVTVRTGEYGFHGGESKQDLLEMVCRLLRIPTEPVGVGSSLPSHVFEEAARQVGVPLGSMPEIGERIAARAGLEWGSDCDSRGSLSGGGSTVTREGLRVLASALG